MQVPQAHWPVRECLAGLGQATSGSMVCGCVKACLHGLAHQAGQPPSPSALSCPLPVPRRLRSRAGVTGGISGCASRRHDTHPRDALGSKQSCGVWLQAWSVRRESLETLHCLGEALQVSSNALPSKSRWTA